ncbi:hypothetical protein POTOM_016198 [Populus tomentosa]|uniref:DUF659 domain-containing protein n=1 Tax=Populus tomentosa TaxID=118781 RepID=A0A8X7ZZ85_POPTO|nr:hypothetical protein POTOM_016198 [Populus tomentosa]
MLGSNLIHGKIDKHILHFPLVAKIHLEYKMLLTWVLLTVRGDVANCDGAPLSVRELCIRSSSLGKGLAQELDHHEQVASNASAAAANPATGGGVTARDACDSPVSEKVAGHFLEMGIGVDFGQFPCRLSGWSCLSEVITDISGNNVPLQNLLDVLIEEVMQQNVVQVMTCSTTSWMFSVINQIRRIHMHDFWAVSASDCIGLMQEKIAAMDDIRRVLDKAKSLVRFAQNNATVLKLFKALQSKRVEGKSAPAVVTDSSFLKAAEMASKTTTSLNLVIDKISDDDEPSTGFKYDSMFCKAHGDFQEGYAADTIENVHLGIETSFEMHGKCS